MRRLGILSLALLPFLLVACGGETYLVREAVKGGRLVLPGDEYGARTVAIRISKGADSHFCSGSIIASDLILSAGHCLFRTESHSFEILFGEDVTRPEKVRHRALVLSSVSEYTRYPRQTRTDLALFAFRGGLPPGWRVNDILSDDHILKKGDTVSLAGYGRASVGLEKPWLDGVLRVAEFVPILDPDYYSSEVLLDQSTKPGGHGMCSGDSGGPVFVSTGGELKLWGINVSVDSVNCDTRASAVDIRQHREWIREKSALLRARIGSGSALE